MENTLSKGGYRKSDLTRAAKERHYCGERRTLKTLMPEVQNVMYHSHGSQFQPHLSGSNALNDHLETPTPAPSISRPHSFNTRSTTTDGTREVIDLTSEEDKGTQKWGGVSRGVIGNREEQDVIKAIEESLKDNQNIAGFPSFAQSDPENPYERRRTDVTPVGLKNIGNSCWFNVIVQANTTEVTVPLLIALRGLAALLKASSRAYVDPTDLLKTISELNTKLNKAVPCIGIQQDATEMLLRLIEWLEKAFNDKSVPQFSSPSGSGIPNEDAMDTSENATPGVSCWKTPAMSSCGETNGLPDGSWSPLKLANSLQMINLDVTYDNLYDSLEAYHLSDAPTKEMWFESLPPVIIFSLVRFSYTNGQTEKVHSKFQFPRELYMDRFLYRNRTFVNEKRIERNGLKSQLSHVKSQLEGWKEFSAGDAKLPLPSLIDAVVKYTSSAGAPNACSPCSPQPMEVCVDSAAAGAASSEGPNSVEEKSTVLSVPSLDRSIIPKDVDIDTVTGFLRTLSADAQKRIDELQKDADLLQGTIDSLFDVDGMKQELYRLHSVIVHEGEANVGHYWAYIASSPLCGAEVSWRKFNDKSVGPATWQQIEEDAFGSRRACSAYCLVYTRAKCEEALYGDERGELSKSIPELLDMLPNDLKLDVAADNALFDAEMIKWDKEHPAVEMGPKNKTWLINASKCPETLNVSDLRAYVESYENSLNIVQELANSLQMINLDVTYDNLYDSLEAYHLSDAPTKEMWFESLPPVIIFSLVRFSYTNGQTEKVHSKFQFPRELYMDRFLYRNRTFVNEKRIERNGLKSQLSHVKSQLEGGAPNACSPCSPQPMEVCVDSAAAGAASSEGIATPIL
ncbi:unnamed protein product [Gongylonema pulchrum]|uniref:Ubiquitin carboxyl-terminal hydrolase n=1 Tax=Gongylonema pulchrum TaxID=637853 RepID=A0A183DNS0_9BILA|nr:unnamed protein product [Gongylonema pulchrum]